MRNRHLLPALVLVSGIGALAGTQIVDITDATEVVVQCPAGHELDTKTRDDVISATCIKSPDGSTSSLRVRVH